MSYAFERVCISAIYAAKTIVKRRIGKVDADTDAPDAHLGHLPGDVGCHQGSVGGHHHAQPQAGAIRSEFEDVGAQEWFAAGEYDDGVSQVGHLIQQGQALVCRQFSFVLARFRVGAAVGAKQIAASCDLPGDQAWGRGVRCMQWSLLWRGRLKPGRHSGRSMVVCPGR